MRVACLQRTVAVRASDTGALAALREPYRPPNILPVGNSLSEDLGRLRPYLSFTRPEHVGMRIEPKVERPVNSATSSNIQPSVAVGEEEDERDGSFEAEALARDTQEVLRLWDVLAQDRIARRRSDDDTLGQGLFANDRLAHGADLMVRVQGSTELPVHRVMLSARCAVLARVLDGFGGLHDREAGISVKLLPAPSSASALTRQGCSGHDGARRAGPPPRTPAEAPRLAIAGVHAFSVLLLLHYLYTDALLAVGDRRLDRLTAEAFSHGRLRPAQAVHELQTLSRVLHLDALEDFLRGAAVVAATTRAPSPLLDAHFRAIFDASMSVSVPDVVLRLADREVWTHSFVLRARSPFFETFFSDEDWTRERFDSDGCLCVDLSHLEWRSMEYVLRFMCCGEEAEMFERLST
jgi:inhibitor of Bruton tyrosine kinase